MVNLDTGELMPSDSAFLHTRSTGVPYVKGARSALLEGFFNRMFGGDTAKVEWYRALVKASLYGSNMSRLVVVLQGKSNSGKSTSSRAHEAILRRVPRHFQHVDSPWYL